LPRLLENLKEKEVSNTCLQFSGENLAKPFVHPYIPNSVPETKKQLMKEIGIKDIEELYCDVPQKFRLKQKLNLPNSMSEQEVKKYVEKLLS
jgi:glycine dehydrogenase subunit 1